MFSVPFSLFSFQKYCLDLRFGILNSSTPQKLVQAPGAYIWGKYGIFLWYFARTVEVFWKNSNFP